MWGWGGEFPPGGGVEPTCEVWGERGVPICGCGEGGGVPTCEVWGGECPPVGVERGEWVGSSHGCPYFFLTVGGSSWRKDIR